MTTTLIVGCGYLGRRVGSRLLARGDRVVGTARTPARAAELSALGIEPVLADVLDPTSLVGLPTADRAFYCVGFDRSSGTAMHEVYVAGLRRALPLLVERVGRLAYASSTGVYGQDDGRWVDEASPTEPRHESGLVVLDAEQALRAFAAENHLHTAVLRFAGLYGPGRVVRRAAIERGEPIVGDPDRYLNLVHVDDATEAVVAAMERGEPGGLYLVSDDRPVLRREYYRLVAERLGVAPPRFLPPTPGGPDARREESNKRVSNRRLRTALGVSLAYPDITTGLPAALSAG